MTEATAVALDLPTLPALVDGVVSHERRHPLLHRFEYRQLQWLVDLDDLPSWGLLARFSAADHLAGGAHHSGIRGDLTQALAEHGVRLAPRDRVVMLAHPRSWGHAFNPLTVFWCLRPDDTVVAVVFEVHNTYGGRHHYVFDATDGRVDKSFYVSPFNDVSGRYDMSTELTRERVSVEVALTKADAPMFVARAAGAIIPATARSVMAMSLRHAFMTWRVSALIRYQGLRLWARRLPIHPRQESS